MFEEIFHYTESFVNWLYILQWKCNPAFQQPGAHGRNGFIEYLYQRFSTLVHGTIQFEIAYGKPVEPHVTILFDAR